MMNRTLGCCLVATLLGMPFAASADVLSLRIGADAWDQSIDGDGRSGPDTIDLNNVLDLDSNDGASVYIAFEHPIPVLPNILVRQTDMQFEGNTTAVLDFQFDDVSYTAGDNLATDFDLSHTDVTLYYELLDIDSLLSLDLGITGRVFSDGLAVKNLTSSQLGKLDIDETLPMLYGRVQFNLPITNLFLGVDANWIGYKESSISDITAKIGYQFDFGLGLELGYRTFKLDYEDENDDTDQADFTVDGGFAGVYFHF